MPPETTPLLGERRSKRSVKAYLQDEVSPEWTDSVLLVGCLATGLLDSAVFNVWSCFVSMQTGKSVNPYKLVVNYNAGCIASSQTLADNR